MKKHSWFLPAICFTLLISSIGCYAQTFSAYKRFSNGLYIKNIATLKQKAYYMTVHSTQPDLELSSRRTQITWFRKDLNYGRIVTDVDDVPSSSGLNFEGENMVIDAEGHLVFITLAGGDSVTVCDSTFDTPGGSLRGQGDFFIIKQDTFGSCVWTNRIKSMWGNNLTTDAQNNIYLQVYASAATTFGQDTFQTGYYVIKLDATGSLLWKQRVDDFEFFSPHGYVKGLYCIEGNNILIAGKLTTDTTVILGQQIIANYYATEGYLLVKADSNGNYLGHLHPIPEISQMQVYGDDIYLAGDRYGLATVCDTNDFYTPDNWNYYHSSPFIVKLEADFNCTWLTPLHETIEGHGHILGIALDTEENVFALSKTLEDTVFFYRNDGTQFKQAVNRPGGGYGLTVFKLSDQGTFMWATQVPTTERVYSDAEHTIAIMPDNDIAVAGAEGDYLTTNNRYFAFIANTDTVYPSNVTNAVALPHVQSSIVIDLIQREGALFIQNPAGENLFIYLLNPSGQILLQEHTASAEIRMDLPVVPPGIYFATVTSSRQALTKQILIQ